MGGSAAEHLSSYVNCRDIDWTAMCDPFDIADADAQTWVGVDATRVRYLLQVLIVQQPDLSLLHFARWDEASSEWQTLMHEKYGNPGDDGMEHYAEGDLRGDLPMLGDDLIGILNAPVHFLGEYAESLAPDNRPEHLLIA